MSRVESGSIGKEKEVVDDIIFISSLYSRRKLYDADMKGGEENG
jgi:hypothetical protein